MDTTNKASIFLILSALGVGLFAVNVTAQEPYWKRASGPVYGQIFVITTNTRNDVLVGTEYGISRSTDGGDTWESIMTDHHVRTLVVSRDGHIFAGTHGGRVFRSTDNGDSWNGNVNRVAGDAIYAMAINSEGHIFVGTVFFGQGVFRSTDNGNTWKNVTNGLTDGHIRALAVNSGGHIFAGTGGGVFRSTDNGDNWKAINNGLTYARVNALVVNHQGHIFAGTNGGVFRSTDNGNTWISSLFGGVQAFAISNDGKIFAGTSNSGVFRSTDNGTTWTQVNNGLANSSGQKATVNALAVNNEEQIFAGLFKEHSTSPIGIFRSTDNGNVWSAINSGLPDTDITALAVNINSSIFAGADAGIFRSDDNGSTWRAVNNGLPDYKQIIVLACNNEGHIFAGTKGLFRSTNNGDTWKAINDGSYFVNSIFVNNSGHIFVGTYGISGGILRSTDNGNTWTVINNGFTNINSYIASAQAFAINAKGHIFAGTNNGVFRSTNNGDTWSRTGLFATHINVEALAINNSDHIFAASSSVFRSTDDGDTWRAGNSGSSETLVINKNGYLFSGPSVGGDFHRSTDNGETWSTIGKFIGTYNRALALSPSGYLYAGLNTGIFRSIETTTSVEENPDLLPISFRLEQNYPNPFNPSTTIQFELNQRSSVKLKILDIGGKEVTTLVNQTLAIGSHKVKFEPQGLPSGVYFYRIEAGSFAQTKKLIFLK